MCFLNLYRLRSLFDKNAKILLLAEKLAVRVSHNLGAQLIILGSELPAIMRFKQFRSHTKINNDVIIIKPSNLYNMLW